MERPFLLLFLAFALALPALARPAPWFKWRSKVDGRIVCAQTSPGDGWARIAQPYREARCEKPSRETRGQPSFVFKSLTGAWPAS